MIIPIHRKESELERKAKEEANSAMIFDIVRTIRDFHSEDFYKKHGKRIAFLVVAEYDEEQHGKYFKGSSNDFFQYNPINIRDSNVVEEMVRRGTVNDEFIDGAFTVDPDGYITHSGHFFIPPPDRVLEEKIGPLPEGIRSWKLWGLERYSGSGSQSAIAISYKTGKATFQLSEGEKEEELEEPQAVTMFKNGYVIKRDIEVVQHIPKDVPVAAIRQEHMYAEPLLPTGTDGWMDC